MSLEYPPTQVFHDRGIVGFGGKSSTQSNTEIEIGFYLTVRASHLWVSPHNEYQRFLYKTITDSCEKGWSFRSTPTGGSCFLDKMHVGRRKPGTSRRYQRGDVGASAGGQRVEVVAALEGRDDPPLGV